MRESLHPGNPHLILSIGDTIFPWCLNLFQKTQIMRRRPLTKMPGS
jgi:hypothetical protein